MNSKARRAIEGKVEFPRYYASEAKPLLPITESFRITGFDIEADAKLADPFLICAHTHEGNDYKQTNGQAFRKNLDTAEDALGFLALPQWGKSINGFWNIGYDSEGIMRFLPDSIKYLLSKNPEVYLDFNMAPTTKDRYQYHLKVIPKKAFFINHVLGTRNKFYDFAQFFGKERLDTVAKRRLDDEKKKEIDASKSSKSRYQQDQEYRKLMQEYCVHDANLTARLGRYLVQSIHQLLPTKNFVSCASIAEQYIIRNGYRTPSIMQRIYAPYLETYSGGRFELFKRGFIENVHDHDLKSAYPWAMSIMPILTENCEQRLVHKEYDKEALFGAYHATIHVPAESYLGPVPVNAKGPIIYPTGSFQTWIDKETLEYLVKRGYDLIIHKGYEIFDDDAEFSLEKAIHTLFAIKENENEDPGFRLAAKVILNSIYGKTIQLMDDAVGFITDLETAINENLNVECVTPDGIFATKHTKVFKAGRMFCPPYGSFITAKPRIRLLEAALEVKEPNLIAFQTDSISSLVRLKETGKKLGDWEWKRKGNLSIAKSGFNQVTHPETNEIIETKARSYGRINDITQPSYQMKRRITLKECAAKRDFTRLNVIEERTIHNNLNTDSKRLWDSEITDKDLRRGGRIVESHPIILTLRT